MCLGVSRSPGRLRQPGATNIKALRALYGMVLCSVEPLRVSCVWVSLEPPVGAMRQPGAMEIKALCFTDKPMTVFGGTDSLDIAILFEKCLMRFDCSF